MNRVMFLVVVGLAVLAFNGIGCNNNVGNSERKQDNVGNSERKQDVYQNVEISSNLSKKGEFEPAKLIGVWDCVKFANTKDGNIISDVAAISKGELTVPADSKEKWRLLHTNETFYIYSLYSDSLSDSGVNLLTLNGSTYAMVPPEEGELMDALINAYSFVIIGNELWIYFTGNENKNILILGKRFL